MQRSKSLPAYLGQYESQPHEGPEQVEHSLSEMDRLNGTSFKDWIKMEENINYISTFKRGIFETSWENNPTSMLVAVQWLTSSWSPASTVEFLLKMFYHWKLESPQFGVLMNGLVRGLHVKGQVETVIGKEWEESKMHDLLHVLLIGESASSTAKFLKHLTTSLPLVQGLGTEAAQVAQPDTPFTKEWLRKEILDLVKSLMIALQWDDTFMKTMLNEYSGLLIQDPIKLLRLQTEIRLRYRNKTPCNDLYPMSPSTLSSSPTTPSYQSFATHILFSHTLLDMILLEAETIELDAVLKELQMNGVAGWAKADEMLSRKYSGITRVDSGLDALVDE